MPFVKLIFCLIIVSIISIDIVSAQDKIQVSANNVFELSLQELLGIKVVSAGKKEENINDIPASVLIVTRNEIEKYGYQDLREVLENIPGFYICDDRFNQDATINVRGFWSPEASHVYFTVNGVSQAFDSFDHFPLDEMAVPIEAIDRIEVIRGPMSVMYGSGAFFGAINIITNDNKETNNSQVSVLYGLNNHERISFSTQGQQNDILFSANAAIEHQAWENLAYNDLMTEPESIGLEGKETGTKPIEKHSSYFNLSGKYKSFYSNLSFASINKGVIAYYAPIPDYKIPKETNNLRYQLGINHHFNKKFSIDAKLEYGDITSFVKDWIITNNPIYGVLLEEMKYNKWEFNTFYEPNDKLDITIGANYTSNFKNFVTQDNVYIPNATNSRFRLIPGEKINKYAIYTEADWQILKNLRITAGLRIDKQSDYRIFKSYRLDMDTLEVHNEALVPASKNNFIPRLAAIYSFKKNRILKVMYGKAIKQPSITNNMDILGYNTSLNQNKPFLKEEVIQTLELNYNSSIKSKYFFNVSIFRNEMHDLIQRNAELIPETNAWLAYTDNSGELVTYGLEFSTSLKPKEDIDITLSTTYQNTSDQINKDIDVAFSPNLLAYIKLSYDFAVKKKADKRRCTTVSFSGNYVDKMHSYWDNRFIDPTNQNSEVIGRIGEPTNAYFTLNTNLRLTNPFFKGVWIDIKINNILNTKAYSPTYTSNAWADKGMIGRTRHIMFSAGYKF